MVDSQDLMINQTWPIFDDDDSGEVSVTERKGGTFWAAGDIGWAKGLKKNCWRNWNDTGFELVELAISCV